MLLARSAMSELSFPSKPSWRAFPQSVPAFFFLAWSKALRLLDVYAYADVSFAALHPHTWRLKKLPAAWSDPAGLGVTHSPRLPSAGLDRRIAQGRHDNFSGFRVWGLGFGV